MNLKMFIKDLGNKDESIGEGRLRQHLLIWFDNNRSQLGSPHEAIQYRHVMIRSMPSFSVFRVNVVLIFFFFYFSFKKLHI